MDSIEINWLNSSHFLFSKQHFLSVINVYVNPLGKDKAKLVLNGLYQAQSKIKEGVFSACLLVSESTGKSIFSINQENGFDYLVVEIDFYLKQSTTNLKKFNSISIRQLYILTNGELVPKGWQFLQNASNKQNPLLSNLGNIITVDTTFIDITSFWEELHMKTDFGKLLKDNLSPSVKLKVLAYTKPNGRPLIWFVTIPTICQNQVKVDNLVFFRPESATKQYAENSMLGITDESHHSFNKADTLCSLSRFLLTPLKPSQIGKITNNNLKQYISDRYLQDVKHPETWYPWLAAGFDSTLLKLNSKTIITFPSVNQTYNNSDAQSNRLPLLIKKIHGLLWSMGKISFQQENNIDDIKIGIAGHSGAGTRLWSAVANNVGKINSIISIDVINFYYTQQSNDPNLIDLIKQCARGKNDFRTVIISKNKSSYSELLKIKLEIEKINNAKFNLLPDNISFWDIQTSSSKEWFKYVFSYFQMPQNVIIRNFFDSWNLHSFIMYGGRTFVLDTTKQPNEPQTYETFFTEALRLSGLGM